MWHLRYFRVTCVSHEEAYLCVVLQVVLVVQLLAPVVLVVNAAARTGSAVS